MNAKSNKDDPYPQIPLSQSGFIPVESSKDQTVKLDNQPKKEKYATVKHLNATDEKNSLQNVDILAQSSSIGPFPFESSIISDKDPKTPIKLKKDNSVESQGNTNINSYAQNNIQKNEFDYNFDYLKIPQLEENKTAQKISYENTAFTQKITNKNDYLTNQNSVNLGIEFNTNIKNNINNKIVSNIIDTSNNIVINNNLNTDYIDTSRIDKNSYSQKITIPEFGEFTFDDNLNLKQLSNNKTGFNITDNLLTDTNNPKVGQNLNLQNEYEKKEVKQTGLQLEPLTNIINTTKNYENGLNITEYPQTNFNTEINTTSNFGKEDGLNLESEQYITTKDNSTQTTRSLIKNTPYDQIFDEFIQKKPLIEKTNNQNQTNLYDLETPKYSSSTKELESPINNFSFETQNKNIFPAQDFTTTNISTPIEQTITNFTSLDNKNQNIYIPQDITTTKTSFTDIKTDITNDYYPTPSLSFDDNFNTLKKKESSNR